MVPISWKQQRSQARKEPPVVRVGRNGLAKQSVGPANIPVVTANRAVGQNERSRDVARCSLKPARDESRLGSYPHRMLSGIHPDGNVVGTEGCIGLQGSDASEFWNLWTSTPIGDRPTRLKVKGVDEILRQMLGNYFEHRFSPTYR